MSTPTFTTVGLSPQGVWEWTSKIFISSDRDHKLLVLTNVSVIETIFYERDETSYNELNVINGYNTINDLI